MAELGAAELMRYQEGMTDQQKMMFMSQYNSERKDRTMAIILSVVLGHFGVDRFYIGDTGIGILKLLTFGLCGILTILDWFMIMGKADDYNRAKATEIATAVKGHPIARPAIS